MPMLQPVSGGDRSQDTPLKSDLCKERLPRNLAGGLALLRVVEQNPHLHGVEIVEKLLEELNINYQVSWRDKEHIPSTGRVVIVANHPLGLIDAAITYRLVSEVRSDVKIVADQKLMGLKALTSVMLNAYAPASKITEAGDPVLTAEGHDEILRHLEGEGAVIFFPSPDLSRLRPSGIRDPKWNKDFLSVATQVAAPILPVFIEARNSALFYSVSTLYKPWSNFLLAREVIGQAPHTIEVQVGRVIPNDAFAQCGLAMKVQVSLFRKHLYRIGRGRRGVWQTQDPIAHPEPRQVLRQEIKSLERLGSTQDGKSVYLYHYQEGSSVLREIGRLREQAFRAVGEGTGQRRDTDKYDTYYKQLVLWDDNDLEIIGAYRLGEAGRLMDQFGVAGLYTHSLFEYAPSMEPILRKGIELGRSFVQPRYWGKRSLDYLWFGIGAYLLRHPEVRYLFGPVSLSNDIPRAGQQLLVTFFSMYFGDDRGRARARYPYSQRRVDEFGTTDYFSGENYSDDFKKLKISLANMNCSIPTLYKQYCELCESGGTRFLDFGIDESFGGCIDGLVLVDIQKIKEKKRRRYMSSIPGQEEKQGVPEGKGEVAQ